MTVQELEDQGYTNITFINGKCYGIHRFTFTVGLMVGIDEVGYESRYCYSNHIDAVKALDEWDGTGDPPGNWIKQKGLRGDRSNPNLGYYTPTIEDFYDGIEYEFKERFTDGTVKTLQEYESAKWVRAVYHNGDRPYILRALTGKNSETLPSAIRIKL